VSAAAVETADGALTAVTARLRRGPDSIVTTEAGLRLLELPLQLSAEIDWGRRSGRVAFAGELSTGLLGVISRRLGTDVTRFYSYEALTVETGAAAFGPDWTFARLDARVRIPRMDSYGVTMEDGRAAVVLEPGRFHTPEAFARIGENYARGTNDHDLRTHSEQIEHRRDHHEPAAHAQQASHQTSQHTNSCQYQCGHRCPYEFASVVADKCQAQCILF
jgi:hypothetical protein